MHGLTLQIYIVDAFTDVLFKGNSCAVCLLPSDHVSDDVLLQIAGEMHKSEIAFIKCLSESGTFKDGHTFGLRWFIPRREIKMCGNGTLSSAAVLFHKIGNKQDRVMFQTLSGNLIVKREEEYIHMDFPVCYTSHENLEQKAKLIKALGDIPGVQDIVYCDFLHYRLVRLKDGWSMGEFQAWTPDFEAVRASTDLKTNVVIVTTRGIPEKGYISDSGDPYDFVSRCFTPWTNEDEHQATGSTKTVLAHYWSKQLSKEDFLVKQCSKRSGQFVLKLRDNRVELLAKATIVMEGLMNL